MSRRKNKRASARKRSPRWLTTVVCLGLIGITWAVFARTLHYSFVNYDDNLYTYENPNVRSGLTIPGLRAAFTQSLVGNWHPLTSISLMLDTQVFGVKPGVYHATNVLLHSIAVVLLFLTLIGMTGAIWRSAFVAALFAVHPLHAESVVWISERKDVLSGIFFMLTLAAYVRYARKPPSLTRYLLILLFFVLGLLSKAMLVTVPFLLLLLDYWPLRRFASDQPATKHGPGKAPTSNFSWVVWEKTPLLVFSAAASIATVFAQEPALQASKGWPLAWRVSNALITPWIYLRQMIWPNDLAIFYPHPKGNIPSTEIALAVSLLLAVAALVFIRRKQCPYLLTGWLWYLGMLVPVVGIIQVGWQAHADRYTYLPSIGIFVLITWGAADLTKSWRHREFVLASLGSFIIGALTLAAWSQVGYWSDSVRLWTHALEVTPNNDVAQRALGTALLQRGQVDEAIAHEREALRLRPADATILTNLGNALTRKGALNEAIARYREALGIHPNDPQLLRALGKALFQNGEKEEALAEYRAALRLQPRNSDLEDNVGNLFFQTGQTDEAIRHFEKAIELDQRNPSAHYNLGIAFLQKGELEKAAGHFGRTIEIQPNNANAHNNLAIAFFRQGETRQAIAEWQEVLKLEPHNPEMHNNIAAAKLAEGDITAAIAQWQETLHLDPGKVAAQISLAWLLATAPNRTNRDGHKALELAQRAYNTANDRNLMTYRVLAAAYAEAGEFPHAVSIAEAGRQRAEASGESNLAGLLAGDLALYEQAIPLRDSSPAGVRLNP